MLVPRASTLEERLRLTTAAIERRFGRERFGRSIRDLVGEQLDGAVPDADTRPISPPRIERESASAPR